MQRCLAGIRVVDLASGLAPALTARLLAGMGADVLRFEPASGDPFRSFYPGYASLHADAILKTAKNVEAPEITTALRTANLVLVGGEDWPGFNWKADAATVAAINPDAVVVSISSYPDNPTRPAVDILIQAKSGICYEQYTERPLRAGYEAASYGAGLQALIAALGALYAGNGQIVRTTYYEGALTWVLPFWSAATEAKPSFYYVLPKDPVPLIFRCRDGEYVHFVMGSAGAKPRVYEALEIDTTDIDPNDSGQPTGGGDPKKIFGDIDLLAKHAANIDSGELLHRLQESGVAAERVLRPGEAWNDPQVAHAGLVQKLPDGSQRVGLPFSGHILPRDETPSSGLDSHASPVNGPLPLSGIRVLDFGSFVGGPFGPQCLADLGADVIKIEPITGEANRTIFKSFISTNRGKRSFAVDMKSDEGRKAIERLVASAQVITSNFRPGVTHRLGIDPGTIHAADPNKIVLEVSGYGRSGPKGALAGWDMVIQALCGLEHRGGGEGNMPLWARSTMVDYATGMLDAVAMLAALIARRRGAGGADLETSLLASGLFLLAELVQAPDGSFSGLSPLNHAQTGFHAAEAMYQAQDGWIAVAARSPEMAMRLAEALELDLPHRDGWGADEERLIANRFAADTVATWLNRLEKHAVWAEPCERQGADFLTESTVQPRPSVVEMRGTSHGTIRQIGTLFRLDAGKAGAPEFLAEVGQHTRELLAELGYTQEAIEELAASNVIR